VCAGLAWSLCGAALAAEPLRFAIPAQPLPDAILAFGGQSGVSIGSGAAATCGRSRPLQGDYEIESALTRLLAGTGCTWRRVDARAFVIVRTPPVVRRPAERHASPAPPLASEPIPAQLAEVVVTATKEDVALSQAPYALSVLDGQDFDGATRRDTADLATRLSGLTITNLGPGRNKIFVRGLADGPLTGQTQAMVGLYLDGTRLTYDVPDPDLRLVDIERVELLRGPQGTLYGAGSIGGILQIITRPPDLTAYGAEVFAGMAAAEGAGASRSIDLVLNAPIIRDRLAFRAVTYSEVVTGSIDDVALGLDNTGDTVREGTRLSLLWRVTPDWSLRLGHVGQTLHSDDSQYAFRTLGGHRRGLSLREPSRNDFDGVSATLSGDLGWARLRIDSAIQSHGLNRRYDATAVTGRFGGVGPTAYDESDSIDARVTEATLSSRPGGRLTWLIGAFATEYSHDRTGDLTQLAPNRRLYESARRDHTDETALYGQASWALTDRLRATAGARLFRLGVETEATARDQGVVSDSLAADRSESGFAPKVVLEYALSDAVLLYAQASEGYRAGGFNAGLTGGYGVTGGMQPYRHYRSDELVSYETGARMRAWNDSLALRLALFAVDWRDIQSDRLSADGLPFTGNIGNATTLGFECELAWTDGRWRVDANLTLADPEIDKPDPGFPDPATSDLSGVPDVAFNLSARRDLSLAARPVWISGSLGYVGASNLIFSASQQSSMGDYWTSDLAAGVDVQTWSVSVRLDNVLGSAGNTFAYGNPFLVGLTDVSTPQRPRTLSVSVGRRF
jgi:iron complex outermembrane recepter protein